MGTIYVQGNEPKPEKNNEVRWRAVGWKAGQKTSKWRKNEIYLRKLSIKVCCTEKEDNGGEYMAAKKKVHRCVGKKREGNRCGQLVSGNSKFCYAHRKK